MENLKIGFLLHFYQPWWQFPRVLTEIVNQCYRPVLWLADNMPGFCFSANINFSLLELLDHEYTLFESTDGYTKPVDGLALNCSGHGFRGVIGQLRRLVSDRKIELLGSTAYHPIMPLIPKKMRIEQMEMDTQVKRSFWNINKNCDGIFLPEMAWSQNILPDLKHCGYKWTIIDDGPFKAQYGKVPFNRIPSVRGFKVFLRSNYWSNRISFDQFDFGEIRNKMREEIPKWTDNQPAYMILAMDAETFGHHSKRLLEKFLIPMVKEWGEAGSGILTPIEVIGKSFPAKDLIKIENGSWSTSEDDYRRDDAFPLWRSKYNVYHREFWDLVNMALQYSDNPSAMFDCMKIISSCHSWWISRRPFWKPEFMKFGAKKAMEIIGRFGNQTENNEAKKIFEKLDSLQ